MKKIVESLHLNQIKLEGDSLFVKRFNMCSELFVMANDDTLDEAIRIGALEDWQYYRMLLEQGM